MRRLAAAAVVTAVALAPVVAAAPPRAAAAGQICVGVVVDFRALGGGVSATCARVPDGDTGNQVMAAAGHRVGFRSDGLVCTVDGLPRQGCSATDSSHYWAYWHRAPGSSAWTYSTQGSGSYRPPNGSEDGWVWQDGGAEGSAKPADVPFATVCHPSPSASPRPPTSAPAAPAHPAAVASAPGPVATAVRSPSPPPSPASPAPRASSPPPSPSTVEPSAAQPSRQPAAAVTEPPRGTGGGFPVGLAAGLGLVALVGGGALWRSRRP